jgi:hypothetical protein
LSSTFFVVGAGIGVDVVVCIVRGYVDMVVVVVYCGDVYTGIVVTGG